MSSGSRAAGCSATWTPPRAPAPPVRAAFPCCASVRFPDAARASAAPAGACSSLLLAAVATGSGRQNLDGLLPARARALALRGGARAAGGSGVLRRVELRRRALGAAGRPHALLAGAHAPPELFSPRAAAALCRRRSRRRARARACLPASLTPASPQDFANDELVELDDRTRLCVWRTMSDEELAPVLSNAEAHATRRQRADARHLLRWCLKGDAAARPTVAQARAPAARAHALPAAAAPGTRLLCRSASARG